MDQIITIYFILKQIIEKGQHTSIILYGCISFVACCSIFVNIIAKKKMHFRLSMLYIDLEKSILCRLWDCCYHE